MDDALTTGSRGRSLIVACGKKAEDRPTRWLAAAVLVSVVAACAATPDDPYPMPTGSPTGSQNNPVRLGEGVQGVALFLAPRAGDRIELVGAEPVGDTRGAHVQFFLSRAMLQPDGALVIGEYLEPLAGAVVQSPSESSAPEQTAGIVAEIVPTEPGRYRLTGVRLRYRLNGGDELVSEGIDVILTVCAGDPAPALCEG